MIKKIFYKIYETIFFCTHKSQIWSFVKNFFSFIHACMNTFIRVRVSLRCLFFTLSLSGFDIYIFSFFLSFVYLEKKIDKNGRFRNKKHNPFSYSVTQIDIVYFLAKFSIFDSFSFCVTQLK